MKNSIFSILLLCFFSFSLTGQVQIGSDIDAEAAGDRFGGSVSISADGKRMAAGAILNDGNGLFSGHVRVFEEINNTWTQIGDDIDGESVEDQSGSSVSLSADGRRLAIGARLNGNVRIFEENNGFWTQLGSSIAEEVTSDGAGGSVSSISLSADGVRIAIGAQFNDGNGTDAGHVRIFEESNGVWTQLGSDIDGEAAGDESGEAIALSANGKRVVIGAQRNSPTGHARIFEENNGVWTQVGSDIDGVGSGFVTFGSGVAISEDGSRVAIGNGFDATNGIQAGQVRIYEDINGNWTQVGNSINGEGVANFLGRAGSIALSANGRRIALGAEGNNGNGNDAGHVRIFEENNGVWTQFLSDIDGEAAEDESGAAVALTPDGARLAVGAPENSGNGDRAGHVRVFEMPKIINRFITTWAVDTALTITIPLQSGTYDFEYKWKLLSNPTIQISGIHTNADGDFTTTFTEVGTYQLEILGDFPHLRNYPVAQLLDVLQWGDIQWESMIGMFQNWQGTGFTATDAPDLSQVTNMSRMFLQASNFNEDLNHWDVSNIVNMSLVFERASIFNGDITDWDVSNVTSFLRTFDSASNFNQDISDWNISSATSVEKMFENADAFNQPIGKWNVSNVTQFRRMLPGMAVFNQPLGDWKFNPNASFNQFASGTNNMSCQNYSATILGWNINNPNINSLNMGGFNADYDSLASNARDELIARGWSMSAGTDIGGDCQAIYLFDCSDSLGLAEIIDLTSSPSSDSTLQLDWLGNASEYVISVGAEGIAPGGGSLDTTTNLFFDLQGLITPNSRYTAHIKGICTSGDTTEWVTITESFFINDLCSEAIPIICSETLSGNNELASVDAPDCGGAADGNSLGTWYSFIGTGELVTVSVDANPYGLATDIGNSQIAVYSGDCNNLICVAGNDDSTPPGNNGSEVKFVSQLNTNYIFYIDGVNSANIGDFEITVISCDACFAVQDVTFSNITANNATVSWNENISATSTQLEFGATGFTPGTGTILNTNSGGPVTLQNLDTDFSYDVYITETCNGNILTSDIFSFQTNCTNIIAPYCEGFDGEDTGPFNGQLNSCWQNINTIEPEWEIESLGTPSDSTGPNRPEVGDRYIYFETSFSDPNETDTLTGPTIDVSNLQDTWFSFYCHMFGDQMGTLKWEISDDMGITWTTLGSLTGQKQNFSSSPWILIQEDISAFGDLIILRFVGIRGDGFRSDIAIDQICVNDTPPACTDISGLISTPNSNASLQLEWIESDVHTEYIVSVGPEGTPPGGGTVQTTVNPFLDLQGLILANSRYTAHVRGVCAPGDSTDWVSITESFFINDLCSEAIPITCSETLSGNNKLASVDAPDCNDAADGTNLGTWYSFIGTGELVTVTVNANPYGLLTDIGDSQIAVFSGNCNNLICVDGNDNSTPPGNNGSQVSFVSQPNINYLFYVDGVSSGNKGDFEITVNCEVCFVAQDVEISNITSNSATVGWSENITATSAEVEFGLTGFTPGTGTILTTNSGGPVTLQGLADDMLIDVYISETCNNTLLTNGPFTFLTECTIKMAPYCEGFDGEQEGGFNRQANSCWINKNTSAPEWEIQAGGTPSSSTGPSGPEVGDRYIYLEVSNGDGEGATDTLTGPVIDISNLQAPVFSFFYHMFGSNMGTLKWEISDDMGTTWTTLDSLTGQQQTSSSAPWLQIEEDISAFGDLIILRFVGIRGNDFRGDMAIDEICVDGCIIDIDDQILGSPIQSGDYVAEQTISSSGSVQAAEVVVFTAGEGITLTPGFQAIAGSDFLAEIDNTIDCSTSNNNNLQSLTSNELTAELLEEAQKSPFDSEEESKLPLGNLSLQVQPNPFHSETQLHIHLPTEQQISMNLFDQMGRLVQTIVPSQSRAAGEHIFSLRNDQGWQGLYFVVLQTPQERMVQKVMITKQD